MDVVHIRASGRRKLDRFSRLRRKPFCRISPEQCDPNFLRNGVRGEQDVFDRGNLVCPPYQHDEIGWPVRGAARV
jgi:hypothetical protein